MLSHGLHHERHVAEGAAVDAVSSSEVVVHLINEPMSHLKCVLLHNKKEPGVSKNGQYLLYGHMDPTRTIDTRESNTVCLKAEDVVVMSLISGSVVVINLPRQLIVYVRLYREK